MIQISFARQLNASMQFRIFKQILWCCLSLSLLIYGSIRIIFFDLSFEWTEELFLIAKMLQSGILFAISISGVLLTAGAIQYIAEKWKLLQPAFILKKAAVAMLVLIIIISISNAQTPTAGTIKDKNTGLTATFKNIKPGKVLLVMNDEILNHTDIPIGESFLLVNNGVKGLVVKAGKISVGCTLLIKDKKGKIIIKGDYLFKGKDTFAKDSTDYKCNVPTINLSMKWEEKYDVTVIFWDKYGSGKIENKVTIRSIDIP